jgi:phage shock protein PspC (stress-responsive transcriptional regulator)
MVLAYRCSFSYSCDINPSKDPEQMEFAMTLAQDLENLEQLRNRGALSEAEFAQAKAQLLQPPAATPLAKASSLNGLRRSSSDRWLGGVCGGLAGFTGLDTWLWRLALTLLMILGGTGFFVYVLMWILVPLESMDQARVLPNRRSPV